jgi:transposase-like protein
MSVRSEFKRMWRRGLTYAEIARALGVTTRALYKWRVELRLANRIRGRRRM